VSGSGARIVALPPEVVEVIAAGEVVERPSSVVKELVENALDAGARRVEVHIEEGGRRLIRVVDDGEGMGPEDLALAFAAHATSKIRGVDDLMRVSTFGFRGEALASIGAVADASIVTRTARDGAALRIANRRGERGPVEPAAGPPGTTVEVRDLFAALPARRKFLRTAGTETARVAEVVLRFALGNPSTGFLLVADGREMFRAPAGEESTVRAARALGRDRVEGLLPVAGSFPGAIVSGFVLAPDAAGTGRPPQYLSVNGRAVADRTVAHAVREALSGLLTVGRQPAWVLEVAVPPEDVDVNVHPAKSEVRFRRPRQVHEAVRAAVRDAVLSGGSAPRIVPRGAGIRDALAGYLGGAGAAAAEASTTELPFGANSGHAAGMQRDAPFTTPIASSPSDAMGTSPIDSGARSDAPILDGFIRGPILQVRQSFLVFETAQGIAVVDQHALHERILLERLRARLRAGPPAVQRLLVPEILETGPADAALVAAAAGAFAATGLEIEPFGPGAVAVHGVPADLAHRPVRRLAEAALALLRAERTTAHRDALVHGLLETMACHAAVRAGDFLEERESRALIEEGRTVPEGGHCAHGRPTELLLTFEDLERRFRR
jgi:DNA mismatch repair protein MutL